MLDLEFPLLDMETYFFFSKQAKVYLDTKDLTLRIPLKFKRLLPDIKEYSLKNYSKM